MPVHSDRFERIDPEEWCLSKDMARKWVCLLLNSEAYPQIITRVAREARVISFSRNRAKDYPGYFRAVVTMQVTSETCALFHSSCSGYRAQYYRSVVLGERANALAVNHLVEAIKSQIKDTRRMSRSWGLKSFSGTTTKTWIHQGLWLRYRRLTDRNLQVARWSKKLHSADAKERKRAVWASLMPCEENRIDLKGSFLTLEELPLRTNPKEARGEQIHDVGFT